MNVAIDAFLAKNQRICRVPAVQLNYIDENTTSNAPLRRFAIALIAYMSSPDVLLKDESREKWPADALWDLAKVGWK